MRASVILAVIIFVWNVKADCRACTEVVTLMYAANRVRYLIAEQSGGRCKQCFAHALLPPAVCCAWLQVRTPLTSGLAWYVAGLPFTTP